MSDSRVSQRRLFMHSAHRTIGVSADPAGLSEYGLAGSAIAAEEFPQQVCLIRSLEPALDDSLARLQAYLETHHGVRSSQVFARTENELRDLVNLNGATSLLLLVLVAGPEAYPYSESFDDGGAVIVQPAGRAFDEPVFGAEPARCNRAATVRIVEAAKGHPVLAGVESFMSLAAVYGGLAIAENATPLLTAGFPGCEQPVAWVQVRRSARIFYTSLGHPDDFRQQSFMRLLANAVTWASGRQ